jgi:uncharacterized protein (TIGR02246 family)
MKTHFLYSLLAASFLMIAACQPAPEATSDASADAAALSAPDMEAIKAEIQARETAYAEAYSAKDAATVAAMYTEDAIAMSDDRPAVTGRAAIQKDMEESYARRTTDMNMSFETVEVFGDANRVTEIGKSIGKDAAGTVVYTGKYMAIWENRDGQWMCTRDISNDDAKDK